MTCAECGAEVGKSAELGAYTCSECGMAHCPHCGARPADECAHLLAWQAPDTDTGWFEAYPFHREPPVLPEEYEAVEWSGEDYEAAFGGLGANVDYIVGAYANGLVSPPSETQLFDIAVDALSLDAQAVVWEQDWMGAAGATLWFSKDADGARESLDTWLGKLAEGFLVLTQRGAERLAAG